MTIEYISTISWHESVGNNMMLVWGEMKRYKCIIKVSSYLGEDTAINLKERLTIKKKWVKHIKKLRSQK